MRKQTQESACADADGGLVKKSVVAKATATSLRTVENWMRQKKIPFVRVSARCVRYHLPSVVAALRRFETKEAGR